MQQWIKKLELEEEEEEKLQQQQQHQKKTTEEEEEEEEEEEDDDDDEEEKEGAKCHNKFLFLPPNIISKLAFAWCLEEFFTEPCPQQSHHNS